MKTKIQNEKKTFIVEILERKKCDNKNYEIIFSKTNLRRKNMIIHWRHEKWNGKREIEKAYRILGPTMWGWSKERDL